ncbi:MAG: hypothetical protein EBS34_01300 [Flavobacteriales bacterium]|nr:hypothetical protein [Flavobacteriales bacterium]
MRIFLLFLLLFYISRAFTQEELLSVQGNYQGGNLLVSNPAQSDGFGFCITKVTVNGDILPASIQSNVFEVNFKLFNLKIGDPVFVVLEHANGCAPKFLNTEVLLPKSTFVCERIQCSADGNLQWVTSKENGVLDFIVEHYRWGKWLEVGYVKGNGGSRSNSYAFQVNLHSGKNTLRVSQRDNSKKLRSSQSTTVVSTVGKVIKTPSRVKDFIYFKSNGKSVKTKYEVFDAYGNLLKQGFSQEVNCTNLLKGIYFLNFDNTSEKFFKID